MEKKRDKVREKISEVMDASKSIKIAVYVIGGIAGFYVIGYVFRIFAHTVRGFKDFSSAIKE